MGPVGTGAHTVACGALRLGPCQRENGGRSVQDRTLAVARTGAVPSIGPLAVGWVGGLARYGRREGGVSELLTGEGQLRGQGGGTPGSSGAGFSLDSDTFDAELDACLDLALFSG